MTAQLVTDALVMAIWRRGKPDALLHHSPSRQLSQTLPDRLIEQTMPWSAIRRWNCSLLYWADSSGRRNGLCVCTPY